jgi:nitroreductase
MTNLDTIQHKAAAAKHGVSAFITDRFSPRAFSDQAISEETMNTLFEAASWAASANNEQPWRYFYALKGTPGFDQLVATLMPGNQPWAPNAAALVVTVARKTFAANGNNNGSAEHDLGMANATLMLQARQLDIFSHPMGGYQKDKAKELLGLDDTQAPMCMIALGYLGSPDSLEEPYHTRELAPRTRKEIGEFVTVV